MASEEEKHIVKKNILGWFAAPDSAFSSTMNSTMTVPFPMASAEEKHLASEDKHEVGLVRCTTNRVLGIYDRVKNLSPILRYGFETVENHIPTAVANLKDPVIDGLDSKIDQVRTRAHKAISPVQEKLKDLDADHDGKVSLGDVKSSVSHKTTEVVARTTEKWKDLRGDLTKKAAERIEKGFEKVSHFSATRGKDIIHVDLIQYSREVIDGASATVSKKFHDANATVRPYYEPVYQNVAKSVLKVSEALAHLQEAMLNLSAEKLEQAKAARDSLHLKLKNAIQAARELSHSSIAFVQAKYGVAKGTVTELPGQVVPHLPLPAQKSVNFILASPQLFTRIKERAEVDASKRTLENIHNLMSAVKDVVFEGVGEAGEGQRSAE
jgi:hypothetical protein